ncbi:hypothetical protein SERN_2009 [Serinibacter arcticus]|uniref:Uncharacterized protein n=1 Tax=Serinibacter arcticus TaxID=1655435 RepID=A0A4Z1DXZ6_9MICO|nr:hypothetical protein SERN_2009 [Serinibacter arcticus]
MDHPPRRRGEGSGGAGGGGGWHGQLSVVGRSPPPVHPTTRS